MVTLSTSCVASFSSIFSSHTPCPKVVIIDASEIRGMVPRTLVRDEGPEHLPGFLPHSVEVSLHTMLLGSQE